MNTYLFIILILFIYFMMYTNAANLLEYFNNNLAKTQENLQATSNTIGEHVKKVQKIIIMMINSLLGLNISRGIMVI